jgi:transcriptional regulator with PAS, ATPase and Fis domain
MSDPHTTRALPAIHVLLRGATFEVVAGPDTGVTFKMTRTSLVVGSGAEVDVMLADSSISRRHVEFVATTEGLLVRDLGSRNGTWIGGLRFTEGTLRQDAVLSLGETSLSVRLAEGALDVEVSQSPRFGGALGSSFAMRHAFALLERAAKSNVTVLLEGESGCGKEVLAHAVHTESDRREGAFVTVDCSSLPDSLIESELFGHEKGAFTGAVQSRAGPFEVASGGTLFLDEIGELPLEQQAKLLRVLENREVRRVGSTKIIPVDVRIVAATNRRLEECVRQGKFRADLFYRISVLRVLVPPLRDRREDIPILAQHFLKRIRGDDATLPAEVAQLLLGHAWPGNVRELRNVVERWITYGSPRPELLFGPQARVPGAGAAASLGALARVPYHEAKRRLVEELDAAYFEAVLERAGGVISKAAELAQVSRGSLYRMLARTRGGKIEDEG